MGEGERGSGRKEYEPPRLPSSPSPPLSFCTAMNFEIRLQPVASLTVVVLVTAVLLGLLAIRPRHVQLLKRQWAALIGLRLTVVLLMLFALLRPSLVYTKVEPV